MPDFNELYRKYSREMEDFWSRREDAPRFERTIHVFGHPVVSVSNQERVLDSATMAERMYSTSDVQSGRGWRVHFTVHDPDPVPAPPPARLIDLLHYAGADEWLSIDLREWGNCFIDMKRGEAYAVLASTLAGKPELVCQVLVNTILTNFITRHGYSMLHASALTKGDDILLLQAPHGTGKSTTALRLLLNGYKLLSDSMVYIGERDGDLWLGGFPVGRIKLRTDMLPLFPAFAAETEAEPVRNETKHRVDLMRLGAEMTQKEMVRIRRVEFCLLKRWDHPESKIEPLSEEELWPEIMVNSLHYDHEDLWVENLRRIGWLVKSANLHRLHIGTSEDEILKTVNQLW